ncbi:hypothetical protein [Flavitalea sp.]|nr:hypothetical protein [Flavitalea sp.]
MFNLSIYLNIFFQLRKYFAVFTFIPAAFSCSNSQNNSWTVYINNNGTYSSPRLVDLNNDQVSDIVIGAGGREEKYSDTAVLALDGKSGKILWAIPGINQYVGSAVFKDINADNVPDIFIGGRWAQLTAINGADGKILWSFYPGRKQTDGSDGGWYNFTTPQFIPDQDNDGIDELIIANGGDARAAPYVTTRPAGRLLVISTKTGNILANAVVPDGKETYMSVICEPTQDGNWKILFGTGGETIGGGLYRTRLNNIMENDISSSTLIARTEKKGFVSSPVLADINNDGIKDIVVNDSEGKMKAIDGVTDSILWQVSFPGTEAYTVPAVGSFTGDSTPDFFANFAIGTFPRLTKSIRFMVDGSNGRIVFQDTVQSFQYASAVTADLDGNGHDEVIINQSALRKRQFDNVYYCYLMAIDFTNNNNILSLKDTIQSTNFASTPWIGDIDNDGKFDIIYSSVRYNDINLDLAEPLGLFISRYKTNIPIKKMSNWGAFMGSRYNGTYP